ncbi:MAG: hypothetical protein JWP88_2340 [Flaviaesturariibacter sp.]|nr:hypothetical protein [Flaviaesturariibacter sp.]
MELEEESLPGFQYYEPDVNEYKHLRKSGKTTTYLLVFITFLVIALLIITFFFPTLLDQFFPG